MALRRPKQGDGICSRVSANFDYCLVPLLVLTRCVAASAEEEVGWDEDSDDETTASNSKVSAPNRPGSRESTTTLHAQTNQSLLKPSEPRKSNDEKSQADSEASYDLVGARSGVPSHAPNSPKDLRKADDSDEEDWE